MKVLIFDSGTLINLSMNGLLYVLEGLKKSFKGKFVVTESVKYEVIDRPIGIHRFELGALRIKSLLDSGVLELPSSLGISSKTLDAKTKEIMNVANHFLQVDGKWVNIVSEAEMSCLALSSELTKKGVDNIIAVDERTTRILAENPFNLEKIMSQKLHIPVKLVAENKSYFALFRFLRSTELVYVAYKKGALKLEGDNVLEAVLYATKFSGSSVSFEEIEEMKRL